MTQVLQAKCPFCQNVLRIPADWITQPLRCKFCKQVIQAKAAAKNAGPAAAPTATVPQPLSILPAQEAQAAFAAPPVAVAPLPRRQSGDPFAFDDAPEPTPIAVRSARKQGKGWLIAIVMVLSLSTVAVLVAVFLGQELRNLFQGKAVEEEIVDNEPKAKGPENENPRPLTVEGKSPKGSNAAAGKKGSGNTDLFPRRALLINVNNYWVLNSVYYGEKQSPGYPGSSGAVIASRLTNAPMYFPATQVAELSDSAASPIIPQKSVIQDAISEFCNTSREQDRIVILFAGHALDIEKEAYLVPYEGNKDDPKTLIPLSWVYDKLAKCKARQKIFILDAFRYPQGRGYELPGTGAMSEDFEAKFHNPPPGVQAWSACVKDQQSLEFEKGSLFLQVLSNAMQERLGGFAKPEDPIPVETLVEKVNQRMKDLLAKTEFKDKQTTKLSGKESESGAAYNPAEPLPPQITIRPPAQNLGEDAAGAAMVNNILEEIKKIPPMKESLKDYMKTLRAESLPPFPKKVMDFYKADYKSWSDLEAKAKDKAYRAKYPLRAAVLEVKKLLEKSEEVRLEDRLYGPINDKTKASFLDKQKPIALAIFELDEGLQTMKEAAEMRDKEESKRWQANFDYTLARLQARLVYMNEYDYILGDIRADRLPTLEGDNTLWRLGFKQKLSTNESRAKNMAKEISKLWKRIEEEHPNTPWALLAQREKLYAMGLEWRASRD